MFSHRPRLVQAEFFPPSKETLEKTLADVHERARNRMRSITVVRFIDRRGAVTRIARRYQELRILNWQLWRDATSAQGSRLHRIGRRSQSVAGEMLRLEPKKIAVSVRAIRAELAQRRLIATEDSSAGPFRISNRDEHHELVERISFATKVWLWVYPEMDLLTESPGTSIYCSF